MTFNNEEYNLKISKSLIMPVLIENNISSMDNSNYVENENNLNSLISKNVQFTYSETTCLINDIILLTNNDSNETTF